SYYSTTTRDREDVFDRHQEGLVDGADRLRDVAVQGLNQLLHSSGTQTVVVTAFQSHQRGTHDDRGVVAGEVVLAQQLTHFHFYQRRQLSVVYQAGLVQEHNSVGNAYLTGQQDVLTGLRQGAATGGAHQDRALNLGRTGNHVFPVVGVA